jgi:hypothetical protein
MRKRVLQNKNADGQVREWLDLEQIATVEVTSEDPNFPIESALSADGQGWRAAEPGEQVIRLVFDHPQELHRIRLEFFEPEITRTQEFALRYSRKGEPLREIVRQQWNFSPQGSTSEIEDYRIDVDGVLFLELALKPDLTPSGAVATLKAWRIA